MRHPSRFSPARFARLFTAALLALAACATARAATAADFASRTYTDSSGSTPYRIFTPRNYNTAARYPLVMFLHGSGERGTNNTAQLGNNANGALVFVQGPAGSNDTTYEAAYPCFMIAPQSTGDWSEAVRRTHLRAIIDGLIAEFSIDPDRVYVTGLSMGGAGAWDQLAQNPTRFAAGVPICGWGGGNYAAFKHVPLWVFHSENDGVVGVSGSDDVVNALRNNGGDPTYSRYATGGHSSWTEAYKNPHLVPWVMAQRRGTAPALNPTLRIGALQHGSTASLSGWTSSTASTTALTWVRTDLSSGTGSSATPGPVTGTTAWSADNLPLRTGSNTFRIQATGTSFSSLNGGATTFSDTVIINHTAPVGDTTAPSLALSTPTTATTYAIATQPLTLTGTSSDNISVTSVTWSSDRTGVSGTATGTTAWSVPNLALLNGANQLTFTATDAAGNTSTTTLLVTYTGTSPNLPPVVQAGADTTLTLPATLTLNGSAYDDGLPASSVLTTLWSTVSGPGTITFANELALATTATFSAPGTYVLRLTAGDSALTASDDLSVIVSPVGTARIRLDLGDAATTTAGNWNNLTAIALNTEIASAIDSTGAATGIRIRVSSAFGAIASSGLTGSPLYPDNASRDYFYVQAAATGRLEFTGLRADRRYTLVLYASRTDPGDGVSRVGTFTVGSASTTLDAVGNTTQTATLADLTADSTGKLELAVRAQNTTNGYALLGALELVVTPTASAPTFASWIATYFPSSTGDSSITGPNADPDRDGLSNNLEYALASRPDQFSSPGTLGRWTDSSSGLTYLTITFRRTVGATGLTVVAQTSTSLTTWSSSTADVVPLGAAVLDGDGLAETVTYRCVQPIATAPRQFLRVHATTP